jgi:DNA-binding NarL/FixJ family response regulator
MDVNMPVISGIEATRRISQHMPNTKIIILTVHAENPFPAQLLQAGASGYLMKDTKKAILLEALIQVREKGYYHTNTVAQLLVGQLIDDKPETVLKDREIEFIKLACTEKNYKEIAELMFLSPKTIEGYRDSIYEKLNIKNRIGLVLYAIRNKMFTP